MKKVIILQHGGGELANQLWNYISIYAYCLEKGVHCENPSFFEYVHFFALARENHSIDLLPFLSFRDFTGRRDAFRVRFWRILYKALYAKPISLLLKKSVVSSQNQEKRVFYLPPTEESQKLKTLEEKHRTLYMIGWLFRNPVGIEKYQQEIIAYFKPNQKIQNSIENTITPLRKTYKHVVGIHIRQGDYAEYKSGEYWTPQKRVREIVDEYLRETRWTKEETFFIITSDGKVQEELFDGLSFSTSNKSPVEDLFTLAACDVILGSNSSFGNFAAYYGNIPHIVFQKGPMDWEYYRDKKTYFQNKYCTLVQY